MPEGDTVFRSARTLNRALGGKQVLRFESVLPALTRVHQDAPITGRIVESVTAAGKHLLMRFAGGLVLRTHMRMNGSWHIYRPGERWRRPRRDMRIVIATADYEAVAFNMPVAEFIHGSLARHKELRQLGPDILAEAFSGEEAVKRIRAQPHAAIADTLLNQRVLAGIGNVYKSEVLFACGVNPFTPAGLLTDAELACIVETARRFLLANVAEGRAPMTTYAGLRQTTRRADPRERLWVYGRAGRPCRRCATPISVKKHGTQARVTYWCERCQSKVAGR